MTAEDFIRIKKENLMSVLDEKAQAVAAAFAASDQGRVEFASDRPFLDILKKLIPIILQLLGSCALTSKIGAERASRPGLLGRFYRRRLRNTVRSNADIGEENFEALTDALIEVGKTTTEIDEAAMR